MRNLFEGFEINNQNYYEEERGSSGMDDRSGSRRIEMDERRSSRRSSRTLEFRWRVDARL